MHHTHIIIIAQSISYTTSIFLFLNCQLPLCVQYLLATQAVKERYAKNETKPAAAVAANHTVPQITADFLQMQILHIYEKLT